MSRLDQLIAALDELTIVHRVEAPHDDARSRYPLQSNRVDEFAEFTRVIGDYYNYQFSTCISRGARLPTSEAASRAKKLLEIAYRRRPNAINMAYTDAHYGRSGGMRGILDKIADGLKAEAVENYMLDVFDHYVAPTAWEHKVELIRQFIAKAGNMLDSTIRRDQPERYAQDYKELVQSYLTARGQISADARRL